MSVDSMEGAVALKGAGKEKGVVKGTKKSKSTTKDSKKGKAKQSDSAKLQELQELEGGADAMKVDEEAGQADVQVATKEEPRLRLEYLVDASLPSCASLLTPDGRHVLVAGPHLSVQVHSLSSSSIVSRLQHPSPPLSTASPTHIVALFLHPKEDSQVVVVCSDGNVLVFDWTQGELLGRVEVGKKIRLAAMPSAQQDDLETEGFHLFVATAKTRKLSKDVDVEDRDASPWSTVYRLTLPSTFLGSSSAVSKPLKRWTLFKVGRITSLAVAPCGRWVGAAGGTSITIGRLEASSGLQAEAEEAEQGEGKTTLVSTATFHAPERITCLAFPPTVAGRLASYFATGMQSGRIALWHALSPAAWASIVASAPTTQTTSGATCPTSILHWHPHAVSSLAFTLNGAYLASGGSEGVLVLWNLESSSSSDSAASREFLPRLGGAIKFLRMQGGEQGPRLLVTRTDGEVVVVDPAVMRVQKSLASPKPIRLPPTAERPGSVRGDGSAQRPPLVACGSGDLVLPSSASSAVQILRRRRRPATFASEDVAEEEDDDDTPALVSEEIEIAPSNRVLGLGASGGASGRDERPVPETEVEMIAVGGKEDAWMATVDRWEDEEKEYEVEVRLKIWKKAADGTFKLVARIDDPHSGPITSLSFDPLGSSRLLSTSLDGSLRLWSVSPRSTGWRCAATFSFRGEPVRSVGWSNDGSLLVAVYERCVVLFETMTWTEVGIFAGIGLGGLKEAKFDGETDERLWVSGEEGIAVFDVATGIPTATSTISPRMVLPLPGRKEVVIVERTSTTPLIDRISTVTASELDRPRSLGSLPGISNAVVVHSDAEAQEVVEGEQGWPLRNVVFLTAVGSLVRVEPSTSSSTAPSRQVVNRAALAGSGLFGDIWSQPIPPAAASGPSMALGEPTSGSGSVSDLLGCAPHVVPATTYVWDELMASYSVPCKS